MKDKIIKIIDINKRDKIIYINNHLFSIRKKFIEININGREEKKN